MVNLKRMCLNIIKSSVDINNIHYRNTVTNPPAMVKVAQRRNRAASSFVLKEGDPRQLRADHHNQKFVRHASSPSLIHSDK